MGLDVYAASHLRYLRPMPKAGELEQMEEQLSRQDKCLDDVYFLFSSNASCHRRQMGGMKPGLYERTARTKAYGFRAGSYSGYNWWRDQLARFALGRSAEDVWEEARRLRGRPFVELIDFTDCDGRVGTRVAAKLAADFKRYDLGAQAFAGLLGEPEAYWLEVYRDFTRALELAAQDGALQFC